jgi:hypothetical protein
MVEGMTRGVSLMDKRITYSDLEAVLLRFGFARRADNGHVVYEEQVNDAVLPLPVMPPDAPVLARHYLAARIIVDGRGVADEQVFESAMRERGELPAGVTPAPVK